MKNDEEVARLKSDLRLMQLKLDALIDILAREGVVTHAEVEVSMKERAQHGED